MSFEKINTTNDQRPEEKHCILYSGYEKKEWDVLNKFFHSLNITESILVNQEMLGLTLEQILSGDQKGPKLDNPSICKSIIMSGFSGKEVETLLKSYHLTNLERPIFAMVTPTSKTWTFHQLIKELMEEREMMAKKNQTSK